MEVIAVGEADDSEKTLGGEADGLLLSAKSDGALLVWHPKIFVEFCIVWTLLHLEKRTVSS